ncbi:MAG TPA: hypothetical protein VGI49_05995 [Mycobacterium sp.]
MRLVGPRLYAVKPGIIGVRLSSRDRCEQSLGALSSDIVGLLYDGGGVGVVAGGGFLRRVGL